MSEIVVTQADREAAAKERERHYEKDGFDPPSLQTPTEMRRGERDWDRLVQAFAHHRQQSCAELIEALEPFSEKLAEIEGHSSTWELEPPFSDDDWVTVKVGHLRDAKAALDKARS